MMRYIFSIFIGAGGGLLAYLIATDFFTDMSTKVGAAKTSGGVESIRLLVWVLIGMSGSVFLICYNPKKLRPMVATLTGAWGGYFLAIIVANLEPYPFHTFRRMITGEEARVDIIEHPADRWIGPVIETLFVLGFAICGMLYSRQSLSANDGVSKKGQ